MMLPASPVAGVDSTAPSRWLCDRRVVAKAAVVATTMFAAATVSAITANATTTLYVPGTAPHPQVSNPNANLSWMGPGVTRYATTAQLIGYPASMYPLEGAMALDLSVAAGVQALDAAIRAIPAGEPIQIIGVSQGDIVLSQVERLLLANPPVNNDITFIRFADPTSPTGIAGRNVGIRLPGMTAVGIPEAPYNSVNVTRQYDGIADWPADSLNILADLNALIGATYLHTQAAYGVDPDTIPDYDITTTTNKYGATNTTYLIEHTGLLPILTPLKSLGVSQNILDALQGPLKKIIDAGYTTSTWSHLHKLVAQVGTKAFQAVVNTISKIASDVGVVLRKLDAVRARVSAQISAKHLAKPAVAAGSEAAETADTTSPTSSGRSAHVRKSLAAKAAPTVSDLKADKVDGTDKADAPAKVEKKARADAKAAHRLGKRAEDAEKGDAKGNSGSGDTAHRDRRTATAHGAHQKHSPRHSTAARSPRHHDSDRNRSSDHHNHGKRS